MVKRSIKIKSAFSLAEALVSMLVISIFFLATYKVMSQRQPDDIIWHAHGFCACYVDSSDTSTKLDCSANGSPATTKTMAGTSCVLSRLPRNSTMYNITIIDGDKVKEKAMFINESATLTPPGGLVIDGENALPDFNSNPEPYEQKLDDYKDYLPVFEPRATFIDNTTAAIYLAW